MTSDLTAHAVVPRTDPLRTHAEMLAAEAQEKAYQRQLQLEELSSDLNSAEQRVRTWEKVHGLSLPRNPEHPSRGSGCAKKRCRAPCGAIRGSQALNVRAAVSCSVCLRPATTARGLRCGIDDAAWVDRRL